MTIYPSDSDRCPLGMIDCFPRNSKQTRPWVTCSNHHYCVAVCEAWKLPLFRVYMGYETNSENADYWKVNFFNYPRNFTYGGYKKYMMCWGWAEPIDLPVQRWGSCLEVRQNKINIGYALSVPLSSRRCYTFMLESAMHKDKQGLWWYGDRRTLKAVLKTQNDQTNQINR